MKAIFKIGDFKSQILGVDFPKATNLQSNELNKFGNSIVGILLVDGSKEILEPLKGREVLILECDGNERANRT